MTERQTERQKKGMDGEGPSAKKLREAGESADVDLDAHLEGKVDPTGHVSSGLQPAPLRRGEEDKMVARDDLTPVTDPQHPEKAKNETD